MPDIFGSQFNSLATGGGDAGAPQIGQQARTVTPAGSPPASGAGQYGNIISQLIGGIQAPQISNNMGLGNSPIVQSFVQMMDQANQANASRGQNILALLQGQGTAQMARNQTNEKNQEGTIDQDLMNRGIYNTTIGSNLKQGAQNELALNNEQVSENSAMNIANVANSFQQRGPDLSTLASLLSQGGGIGVGGGGGGGFRANTNSGMAQYYDNSRIGQRGT